MQAAKLLPCVFSPPLKWMTNKGLLGIKGENTNAGSREWKESMANKTLTRQRGSFILKSSFNQR